MLRRILGPQPELRLLCVLAIIGIVQLFFLLEKADQIERSINYLETCGIVSPCDVNVQNTVDVREGY